VKRARVPILFLFGRHDQLVRVRDAVRYYRAAPQPKEMRWYDADHFLVAQAWCDAGHFLGKHVGVTGRHFYCH
jgi:uncharacterized protein